MLLERVDDGWALPHVYCDTGWIADAVGPLQTHFRDRYGLDVFVLRPLFEDGATTACELELLSGQTGDSGQTRWMDSGGGAANWLPASQRAAVEAWRSGRCCGTDLGPWQKVGWFAEARQWMLTAAANAGIAVQGPVVARKGAWNGSCVLQAESSAGPIFLKASPARRPGEPRVLRELLKTWPRNVPALVAGEEARCWTLMRNVPGAELDPEDTDGMADALRLMAQLQLAEVANVATWLDMGCSDRRLEKLSFNLERLLIEIPARLCEAGLITPEERDGVARAVSPARDLCRQLQQSEVPAATLHHEDFRAGNVRRAPGGDLVILDWNDVALAHPFFAAQRMFYFVDLAEGSTRYRIGDSMADQPRRQMRDAYLGAFAPFARPQRLAELFQWSLTLAPVYDAFRFAESADVDAAIQAGLDPDQAEVARHLIETILKSFRSDAE